MDLTKTSKSEIEEILSQGMAKVLKAKHDKGTSALHREPNVTKEHKHMDRQLIVFAGPNGSGKTTITRLLSQFDFPKLYINADDIKKEQDLSSLEAAQVAEKLREEALSNGVSFVMETVLSTERNIRLMQKAKELDYNIILIYVLTQDSDINIDRVKDRVKEGGHDVPEDKIIARYKRCLDLLPTVLLIPHIAFVFDNSSENPTLITEKNNNSILLYSSQSWNTNKLSALIGKTDCM